MCAFKPRDSLESSLGIPLGEPILFQRSSTYLPVNGAARGESSRAFRLFPSLAMDGAVLAGGRTNDHAAKSAPPLRAPQADHVQGMGCTVENVSGGFRRLRRPKKVIYGDICEHMGRFKHPWRGRTQFRRHNASIAGPLPAVPRLTKGVPPALPGRQQKFDIF